MGIMASRAEKCWPTISSQPDQRHHPPSFRWCWRSGNSRTSWNVQQHWCYCETSRRSHHGPVEERPLSGMGCDLPRHFREFAYSNVQCFCWFSRENCGRQETREILRPHRRNWLRAHSHRINRRLGRARLWTSSRTRSSVDCSELRSKIDVISATANFASGAARERLLRSGNIEKKIY